MSEQFDRQVRPFIDLIDSLRSLGLDEDVNLPSVVVIGDQSTGKSSVLEAISAVQLPRGSEIVTRCALELRMKNVKANDLCTNSDDGGDYWRATLSYTPPLGKKISHDLKKPEEVSKAVEEAQNVLAGKGKNICTDSIIRLEVESPHVPDLTLIDLPGIARVAGEGQKEDIEEQTKSLIKQYIEKEETIILCVIPCTSDIATTEALKLAKQADPRRQRTLGVMTKPDLVDPGSQKNVVTTVQNVSAFKLKLGYTLVKCRGQKDIDDNMSLQKAIEEEKRFFKNHKTYKSLFREGLTGTERLAKQLTRQLVTQIHNCLPHLRQRVCQLETKTTTQLERLGTAIPRLQQKSYLIEILQKYGNTIERAGVGDYRDDIEKRYKLYATVHEHFTAFQARVNSLFPGERDEDRYLKKIEKEMSESRGQELPGFPSFGVFRTFAIDHVNKIKHPAMQLLNDVRESVRKVAFGLACEHFDRFTELHARVESKTTEYLSKRHKEAKKDIESIFKKEKFIFTQDKNFKGLLHQARAENAARDAEAGRAAEVVHQPQPSVVHPTYNLGFRSPMAKLAPVATSTTDPEEEDTEVKELLLKLRQYSNVVRAILCDTIPKTIYFYLITLFSEDVKISLLTSFDPQTDATVETEDEYLDSSSDDDEETLTPQELLRESSDKEENRRMLTTKVERLRKAERKLRRFGGSETTPAIEFEEENVEMEEEEIFSEDDE